MNADKAREKSAAPDHKRVVFFTGAGCSRESGIPTYRGAGGIWKEYPWQNVACQEAFDRDSGAVLDFHEKRRRAVMGCSPHAGHFAITHFQRRNPHTVIITQNVDGMHQRAGSRQVIELHGSLWRGRCSVHGVVDLVQAQDRIRCPHCDRWLRPDITWFGDPVDTAAFDQAIGHIKQCDFFICVGTSGVVWPAAGLLDIAASTQALCIDINPENTGREQLFDQCIRKPASVALPELLAPRDM